MSYMLILGGEGCMWDGELNASMLLAREAGKEIIKIYEQEDSLQVDWKKDCSPLTSADSAANKIIVQGLRKKFPNHAILSEEEKDSKERLQNDYCFVVDPLDGTKEFIKRNGQFTVNIALAYRQESVMGVIYVPVTGDLYYAAKGYGAYLMSADGKVEQLHVSDCKEKSALRVVKSNSHDCVEMEDLIARHHLTNCVRMGSSLKGCLVASGDAEVYYRYNPTMEWDTAAMQCIVEEAGGIFRQMDDSLMLYNRENCRNENGFYAINCLENRLR